MINFDKVPAYIRREIDAPQNMLRLGAKNRRVKQIQEWLNFHHCRTAIDGHYGPATAACVSDFQGARRRKRTGQVDAGTWNLLVKPLREALAAPDHLHNCSAQQAVLAVAEQHICQHPVEIGGENRGPWVRVYCEGNEGREWAWCAGFVSLIIQQAYFYRDARPPIHGSVSCDSLAAQAKQADCFVDKRQITHADYPWDDFGGCCVFLRRRTATDWTHAGFATSASGDPGSLVFSTIEGNTNDEGVREGFEACRRKRGVIHSHYDFIALDQVHRD